MGMEEDGLNSRTMKQSLDSHCHPSGLGQEVGDLQRGGVLVGGQEGLEKKKMQDHSDWSRLFG